METLLYCYVLNNGFKIEKALCVAGNWKTTQKLEKFRWNPKKYLMNVYACSFSIDKKKKTMKKY